MIHSVNDGACLMLVLGVTDDALFLEIIKCTRIET